MIAEFLIPEPILFNPLKHHLGFIREFIYQMTGVSAENDQQNLIRELKHLGTSVMDVYTGSLPVKDICNEVIVLLQMENLSERMNFSVWTEAELKKLIVIRLSDGSEWTLKYHDNSQKFVHIFPARGGMHSLRVKSNTLKSALLYIILVGKDFITADDLNRVRPLLGLSPIRDPVDTEAITEMIEILRNVSI